jgi:hypothetical protein
MACNVLHHKTIKFMVGRSFITSEHHQNSWPSTVFYHIKKPVEHHTLVSFYQTKTPVEYHTLFLFYQIKTPTIHGPYCFLPYQKTSRISQPVFYPVHIRALIPLHRTNTDTITHITSNHHFINTVRSPTCFNPYKIVFREYNGYISEMWVV